MNLLSASELELIKSCVNQYVKKYTLSTHKSTNVIACKSNKDADAVLSVIEFLDYKAAKHVSGSNIFEVVFN